MALTFLKRRYWAAHTRWSVLTHRQLPAWQRYRHARAQVRKGCRDAHAAEAKRLLLLAWQFPPAVTGGVYRPAAIARYAITQDWEVSVVAGPAPAHPDAAGRYLQQRLPAEVEVHRAAAEDTGPHPWPLPEVDGGILNALSVFEAANALLAGTGPAVIVATGPPFHTFVAAHWLAETTGSRLVLDYRDEWTEGPFGFAKSDSTNRAWERRCLLRADRVIFTTLSQLEHQVGAFPELDAAKCRVVHNGWEPEDFSAAGGAEDHGGHCRAAEGHLDLAFFGKLGAWSLPPDFLPTLAEVFRAAPDLRESVTLRFVGQKSAAALDLVTSFPFAQRLSFEEQLPKDEACRRMRSSGALLLMNPPSLHRYIPGKTYDYLASGRPILLYGSGGELAAIVEQLDAGIVVPAGDAGALERSLREIGSRAGAIGARAQEWLQSRTRAALAREMLAVLDEVRGAPAAAAAAM